MTEPLLSNREALSLVIAAWEALSSGDHTARRVQQWLGEDMKPAIDAARTTLANGESTEPKE